MTRPEPTTPEAPDALEDASVANAAETTTPPTWKLGLQVKISYGISTFGNGLFEFSLNLWLFYFYTDIVGLSPMVVGIVVPAAIFIDALTDIPMGWISDRTRTRWGRRRPYILLASLFYPLAYFALFSPPEGAGALYLFLTASAYYLGATLYLVPYNGLGTELTLDHHERTSLMAYRQGFFIVGLVLGAFVKVLVDQFSDERTGFSSAAAISGVIMMLTMWESVRGTFERREFAEASWKDARPAPARGTVPAGTAERWPLLRAMLRNKPFLIVLRTFVIYNISILVPVVVGMQVAKHWLRAEHVFPYAVLGFLVCGVVAVPIWTMISKRIDKRPTLIMAFALASASVVPMVLLSPDRIWLFFAVLGVMGLAFGGFMTLPMSIIGDTVDYDEYLTGRRREGIYWGTAEFSRKITQGAAYFLIGQTLSYLGYEGEAAAQSASALLGLKILFIAVPIVLFALAAVSFWSYPLSKERHNEMHREMGRSVEG